MIALASLLLYSNLSFGFDQTHKKWTDVLSNYQTKTGLVKYSQLKKDIKVNSKHAFTNYLSDLQSLKIKDFKLMSKNDQMAFLINSYNAFTIKLILDHYPTKSIKKIGGFFSSPWKLEFFSLFEGQIKALDPIEHEWLRPKYKDYRIHAAVNCASISCPPLRFEAYTGTKLDQQLSDQMTLWLKDQTRNQISKDNSTYKVSKIFDWYKEDFETWGGGILNVISKHLDLKLSQDQKTKARISYLNYDWSLNESK